MYICVIVSSFCKSKWHFTCIISNCIKRCVRRIAYVEKIGWMKEFSVLNIILDYYFQTENESVFSNVISENIKLKFQKNIWSILVSSGTWLYTTLDQKLKLLGEWKQKNLLNVMIFDLLPLGSWSWPLLYINNDILILVSKYQAFIIFKES